MGVSLKLNRVVIKVSGEALAGGRREVTFDDDMLTRVASELVELQEAGVKIAVVTGGGNILRGAELQSDSVQERVYADYLGMVATILNGGMLKRKILSLGGDARLMAALRIEEVAEPYIQPKALSHLTKGRIVIIGGGTGMAGHSTDFAASQRAYELEADMLLKGTSVDGVFDADPKHNPDATMFTDISYREIYERELGIMDMTAFTHCRDNRIPITVFNVREPGNLVRLVQGEDQIGTLIHDPESSGLTLANMVN